MSHRDQSARALRSRSPGQIGHAIFGDNNVDVSAGCCDRAAQARHDPRAAVAGPGGQADDTGTGSRVCRAAYYLSMASAKIEAASLVADAATRLHRAVVHIGSARLRPWNVTLSSYAALRVLETRPDLTLAQLSLRCFVRPQTMTRMVTQLEGRGWIDRSKRPSDDRALSLRLSSVGVAALREMDQEAKKINATIDNVLTPEEIGQLNELLRRCATAVEDELRVSYPQDAY